MALITLKSLLLIVNGDRYLLIAWNAIKVWEERDSLT